MTVLFSGGFEQSPGKKEKRRDQVYDRGSGPADRALSDLEPVEGDGEAEHADEGGGVLLVAGGDHADRAISPEGEYAAL